MYENAAQQFHNLTVNHRQVEFAHLEHMFDNRELDDRYCRTWTYRRFILFLFLLCTCCDVKLQLLRIFACAYAAYIRGLLTSVSRKHQPC